MLGTSTFYVNGQPCEWWGYYLSCHFHISMFTPFHSISPHVVPQRQVNNLVDLVVQTYRRSWPLFTSSVSKWIGVSLLSLRMSPLLTWHSDVGWVSILQHQDNKPTNSTKSPNPTYQPNPNETKHCQVWTGPSLPAELLRGACMASPGPGAKHAAPCWDGARHKMNDIFGRQLVDVLFVWRLGCIDV